MNVRFSGVLLRFVGYRRQLPVEAETIGDGLQALVQQYELLKPALFDGEGNIRTTHRLFLNGNQLIENDLKTAVAPEDTLEILTALAGG